MLSEVYYVAHDLGWPYGFATVKVPKNEDMIVAVAMSIVIHKIAEKSSKIHRTWP